MRRQTFVLVSGPFALGVFVSALLGCACKPGAIGGATSPTPRATDSAAKPPSGEDLSAPGPSTAGCAGTSFKLCEDFESAPLGAAPAEWTSRPAWGPGNIGVASDQVHSGSKALKSDSISPGQPRIERSLAALGATAASHWGRLFYKVQTPAPKAPGLYLHVTFAALEGKDECRVVDTVEDPAGKHQFLYNVPDDSCCSASTYDWTFDDNWHCAEWHIDAATKSYNFYIDSKEVTSLAFTGNNGSKMSPWSALALGQIFYVSPPSAFTSWIDDVALDDTRIGCN